MLTDAVWLWQVSDEMRSDSCQQMSGVRHYAYRQDWERGVRAEFYRFDSVYVFLCPCTRLTKWVPCAVGTFRVLSLLLCVIHLDSKHISNKTWVHRCIGVNWGKSLELLRPWGGQWGMDENKQTHFAQAWNAFQGMWTEIQREAKR